MAGYIRKLTGKGLILTGAGLGFLGYQAHEADRQVGKNAPLKRAIKAVFSETPKEGFGLYLDRHVAPNAGEYGAIGTSLIMSGLYLYGSGLGASLMKRRKRKQNVVSRDLEAVDFPEPRHIDRNYSTSRIDELVTTRQRPVRYRRVV